MTARPADLPEPLADLFSRAEGLAALLDAPLAEGADVPRPEHPRPQLQRPTWMTLNGTWQFEIDQGDSGRERGLLERELAQTITVPFAPETEASGIGNR
ncbi:MAG: beta-galactosidase, partial [Brachybacterium tyrofermentans]